MRMACLSLISGVLLLLERARSGISARIIVWNTVFYFVCMNRDRIEELGGSSQLFPVEH